LRRQVRPVVSAGTCSPRRLSPIFAGRDQRFRGIGEEPGRPLLSGALNTGQRRGVPLGLIGKNNVEEIYRITGIGEMGRDSRPHGSGAQHRNTAKWLHQC